MAYLNNKAQALSELAVFGTVLLGVLGFLLTYGMNSNYSDNMNMQAFRHALQKAYDARRTYYNSQVIVMDYKAPPQAQGVNAITSFSPVIASSSALLSNDLMSEWDEEDYGNYTFIPKINLLVKDKSGKIGKAYNFTTADWREYDLNAVEVKEKEDDADDTNPPDGIYWRWKTVALADVQEGGSYDVDEDGKEETVIFFDKDTGIARVMDSQEGEMDFTLNSQDLRKDIFASHGLISGEQKQRTQVRPDTHFKKSEGPGTINSEWAVDMEDNFYHPLKLNRVTYNSATVEADSIVEQMQAGDEIWIDINKDKVLEEGEKFSKTALEAGGFEVYNGKEQDIILWINNKIVRQEGRSWSTPN